MAPRSRGVMALLDTICMQEITRPRSRLTGAVKLQSRPHICGSCRNSITQARFASTATAQVLVDTPPTSQLSSDEPVISPESQLRIIVKAGIVVSRAPLTTPDQHPFDTAFHLYQRRLNERVVLPFTQYFHYKRGTPAFNHWREKRRERGGVATRDIGKYNAYTKESWNDEVLVGDQTAQPSSIVEQLIEDEGRGSEFVGDRGDADEKLAGLKRTTDADQKHDEKSLERVLNRTLYLLVRSKVAKQGGDKATSWRFPSGDIEGKDSLKETAERVLASSCGVNMNTWFVASHPIGHHVEQPATAEGSDLTRMQTTVETADIDLEKTFFMKARIFAGQADVISSSFDLDEFKWLTKEEVEKHVSPEYWASIKNMLVEQ